MNTEDNVKNNSEEYNKLLLKQSAITFSLEGISKDIKIFIQKKISHNRSTLSHFTQLMDLTLNSEIIETSKEALKKGGPLNTLFQHIVTEIVKTDRYLDSVIETILEKEKILKKEKEETNKKLRK